MVFDPTPEIFATDAGGTFLFPLLVQGHGELDTSPYDEVRLMVSLWHPSAQRSIDLDRAYVELRACFDPREEHWVKVMEIEPVVPAYSGGDTFDGWIGLPVLAPRSAYSLFGSGFDARARLQVRAYAYLVA